MPGQRNKSHIIGEIGAKHVELIVARAGYTVLAVAQGSDYGYDLPVITFDAHGKAENGFLLFQIKSSQRTPKHSDRNIHVRLKEKHIELWLNEPWPVILVHYDHSTATAYWLYLQRYLNHLPGFSLQAVKKTFTVKIPAQQILTAATVRRFASFKRRVIIQLRSIDHG